MNCSRFAIRAVVLTLLLFPAFTSPSLAASQDDIMERIRLLEIQIQQLKELKAQQKLSVDKEQQCMKPVGNTIFCKCIAETLPRDVNFEQYVHFLVTTRDGLKYDAMKPEARQDMDASLAARDKCVDKGWSK